MRAFDTLERERPVDLLSVGMDRPLRVVLPQGSRWGRTARILAHGRLAAVRNLAREPRPKVAIDNSSLIDAALAEVLRVLCRCNRGERDGCAGENRARRSRAGAREDGARARRHD